MQPCTSQFILLVLHQWEEPLPEQGLKPCQRPHRLGYCIIASASTCHQHRCQIGQLQSLINVNVNVNDNAKVKININTKRLNWIGFLNCSGDNNTQLTRRRQENDRACQHFLVTECLCKQDSARLLEYIIVLKRKKSWGKNKKRSWDRWKSKHLLTKSLLSISSGLLFNWGL